MNYISEVHIQAESRTRRMRMTERMRRLVRETELHPSNFILPLFASDAAPNYRKEVTAMPGVYQLGIDNILRETPVGQQRGFGQVGSFDRRVNLMIEPNEMVFQRAFPNQ